MDVQSFLGLAGYYHWFDFSHHCKAEDEVNSEGAPFVWIDDCEASSCTLKKKLVSAPILVLPESGKHFIVYTDASRVSLGYVFMQKGRVISYASRKLSMRRIILHVSCSGFCIGDLEKLSLW